MLRPTLLVVVLMALPWPGAAQDLKLNMARVEMDYDRAVDFSGFKTYGWVELDAPAKDPSNHANLRWHLERGLEKKGLRRAPEGTKPDLQLRYSVLTERKIRGNSASESASQAGSGGDMRTSVSFERVDEGVLFVDLTPPGAEGPAWRAETDFRIPDKRHVEQETRSAIGRLLARYPPPKDAPKP
jgi:hypothetical protein